LEDILKKIIFIFSFLFAFIQLVSSNDIGDIQLSEIKNELEMYCINIPIDLSWENVEVLFTLRYDNSLNIFLPPDRYQLPSEMLFLSNSIMILNSVLFSSSNFMEYKNYYFIYSLNDNELTLNYIDSRFITEGKHLILFEKYALSKNYFPIISVDVENNIVVYIIEDGFYLNFINEIYLYSYKKGFYFGGYLFHGEYIYHERILNILDGI
jgi:hypothetical protein